MGKEALKKENLRKFKKICEDIKNIRIQGAESVAIAGLKAYLLIPSRKSIKKLLGLRPTEPALRNALVYAERFSVDKALKHFKDSEDITKKLVYDLVRNNSIIFTHCHSSSVVDALIYAKKHGRKFEVYNTETRPLYQGHKTARELAKAGIKVTTVIEAAARAALVKDSFLKESDAMLIGSDAIFSDGSIVNKIGSAMFAEIAYYHKIPVYIVTDSWKFSPHSLSIEERNFKEIWKRTPKDVKVKNPAFEKVEAEHITAIISELGALKPKEFVKKVKKTYSWIK